MRCLVLGAGVVGEAVAWDLTHVAPTAGVTIADIDTARLEQIAARVPVATRTLDVSRPGDLEQLAGEHDVVVGALPSTLGYAVLERLCRAGVRACDVSFMPEDAGALHPLAHEHGATVVYDCGVAPGLSHVLVGAAVEALVSCEVVRIEVGGVPEHPRPPFYYKAPFAPLDVIEEYTRPVHLVVDDVHTVVEPLTGVERLHVEGVGELDAFYTDGLRSLVRTVQARHMGERTLRHPGHLAVMTALSQAGFFDSTDVEVRGAPVCPRDLTAALLLPHWRYADGETDVTVLRVEVSGRNAGGERVSHLWTMVDRPVTSISGSLSSMARTTGCPAAIVARWLADGTFHTRGAHPPETLGFRGLAGPLLTALGARGIRVEPGA